MLPFAVAYVYSNAFFSERTRGTEEFFLRLPAKPFDLVLAKFLVILFFVLVNVTIPVLLTGDGKEVLYTDGTALLITTLMMAGNVVSREPMAQVLPLFVGAALSFVPYDQIRTSLPITADLFTWIETNVPLLAVIACLVCPLVAVISASIYARKITGPWAINRH